MNTYDHPHVEHLKTAADNIPLDWLRTPVGELSDGQAAVLRAVLGSPYGQRLLDRLDDEVDKAPSE